MGLFDIFTGAPARRAAAENSARLGAAKTSGMGYLDSGLTNATGALDTAAQPLSALGTKYGAGTDLYLDSLGVNGADGTTRAQGAFTAGPGYEWQMGQGLDALNRRRASGGMLNSGNADIDAINYGQGLAKQEYGGWQTRLAGLMQPEMTSATGLAALGGQKAGLYANDANQRVGLESNIANGQNSQTTQAANAQMQGSGNLLNFGMNLASLAAGGMGGGGLFGSFGGGQSMNNNPGNGAGGYAYPVYR